MQKFVGCFGDVEMKNKAVPWIIMCVPFFEPCFPSCPQRRRWKKSPLPPSKKKLVENVGTVSGGAPQMARWAGWSTLQQQIARENCRLFHAVAEHQKVILKQLMTMQTQANAKMWEHVMRLWMYGWWQLPGMVVLRG